MTATLTRPTTTDTDRALLAAASRVLREAGWVPDRRTPAEYRTSRSHGEWRVIEWDLADDGVGLVGVIRPVRGVVEHAHIPVTSIQQAIDVVSALTGVGTTLTRGHQLATATYGRLAAVLMDGGER